MPSASSTPGTLGLYINSFKKNGSNPVDNASPYKRLLGTDGYGSYSGGNKITETINYCTQFGYNYALFYDMTGSAMTATQTSETFLTGTGVGIDILNNVMPRFHAGGIVDRAAVSDINLHQTISTGAISPWDGISAIKRTVDWNQSVAYDPTLAFTKIVIETEFWNFNYHEAGLMSGIVRTLNSSSGGFPRGEVRANSTPINFSTSGVSINDSIVINNEWRQVTGFDTSGNIMYVDRPWNVPVTNQIWRLYEQDGSIDYETYLYRIGKAVDYINTYGSGEEIDLYVGFPSYDFKATHAGFQGQLAKLYQAGVSKILITAYQRFPNFGYMNGNYANGATYTGTFTAGSNIITNVQAWGYLGGASISSAGTIPNNTTISLLGSNTITMNNAATATGVRSFSVSQGLPSGGYRRITDDICSDAVSRDIGVILSMESATMNNNFACPGGVSTNNNFSGYIMQGMSVTPHAYSTDFKAIDSGGITQTCNCCVTPVLTAPPITYNPLSMDEIWQYIAEVPPSGGICPACYPTQTVDTFNEEIAADPGGVLDNYITFDTLIVFDQEFMRQLDITPEIAFTVSTTQTNVTCNGFGDGVAAVSAMGGVAPFTYEWQSWDGFVWTTFLGPGSPDYVVFNLTPGDYQCIVTDAAATVVTSDIITITEPSAISFTTTVVNANCAGVGGQITMVPSGGTGSYLYSCVLQGNPPVWGSNPVFTGLTTGTWTCTLADGNPVDSCITSTNVAVATGASFTITSTHTEPTCYGGFGTVTVTPSTPGSYIYNLNLPGYIYQSNTTGIFTNIPDGEYSAQAFNLLGCTSNIIALIKVTNPAEVTASGTNTNPTCYLGTDGSITIVAGGGSGVYSYFIQYPSGVTLTNGSGIFTGLGPLTYDYYVQDNLGCQSNIGSITISNPSQITPVYEVIQISEDLAIGGSITLNYISGGTNPYSYLWNTGETTESLSNLVPGTYTVTITDDNGCEVIQSFTIRVECTELSYDSYKVQIYKAQCCAGKLAKKYVKFMQQGREDLAFPVMQDITTLTLILNAIKCDDNPGDQSCFTCDEMITLLENIKNICSCDCCQDQDGDQVTVTFNPESGQLDIIE